MNNTTLDAQALEMWNCKELDRETVRTELPQLNPRDFSALWNFLQTNPTSDAFKLEYRKLLNPNRGTAVVTIQCHGVKTLDVVRNLLAQEKGTADFLTAIKECHKDKETGRSVVPNLDGSEKVEIQPPWKPVDKFSKKGGILIYPFGKTIRLFLSCVGGFPGGDIDITDTQLRVDIEEQARNITEPDANRRSWLEEAEARKIHLFVDFFRPRRVLPRLDMSVAEKEMRHQIDTSGGGEIYDRLKDFFLGMTIPRDVAGVQDLNGIILYGPPGTGKTYIAKNICTGLGLAPLHEPIAASEIAGGKVGDSEEMLKALLERAKKFPWLPCYQVIDELDTIAPNRLSGKASSNPSEHKQGVLTLLLTLIGGARHIENLFLIGGTNRFSDMDPAFLRRMQGKFFVGLPSSSARRSFLQKSGLRWTDDSVLQQAVVMTTNFSVDNMLKVNHRLCVNAHFKGQEYEVTHEDARSAILEICRSEKVMIGNRFLPDYLDSSSNVNRIGWSVTDDNLTGRVFVDLKDGFLEAECIGLSLSELNVAYKLRFQEWFHNQLGDDPRIRGMTFEQAQNYLTKDQAIAVVTKMNELDQEKQAQRLQNTDRRLREVKLSRMDIGKLCSIFATLASSVLNVGYFQVVTSTTLYRNKATDDKEAMEFLTNLVDECTEYSASLLLFDLDSIIGVDNHEAYEEEVTDPNKFKQSSVTFLRPQLLNTVLNVIKDRAYHSDHRQFFVVLATRDPNLRERVRKYLEWPSSTRVQELIEERNKEYQCRRCFKSFKKAKPTKCRFHTVDSVVLLPLQDEAEIEMSSIQATVHSRKDKQRIVWACCNQPFLNSQGCQEEDTHLKH